MHLFARDYKGQHHYQSSILLRSMYLTTDYAYLYLVVYVIITAISLSLDSRVIRDFLFSFFRQKPIPPTTNITVSVEEYFYFP